MDKEQLIAQIVAHLEDEWRRCLQAARAAGADATDEQNKAENKYDTRGLEASYLARGQSLQTAEIEQARHQYAAFSARDFGEGEPVAAGAVVEVEQEGQLDAYFLGPAAGGLEITLNGRKVLVLTGRSPLGQKLLGKRAGDSLPGGLRIVSVA